MKKESKYKILIIALLFIIILQGIFSIISRPKRIPEIPVKIIGKVAIVIDDWGYNLNNLRILDRIKYPLTVSVLPHLNYSREVASELRKRGLEIILHLPMEPHEKYRLEKNTIMVSMDEATIKNIIDKDLANIIYAKGVSNHMGSLATEDIRTMEVIFRELKGRTLFFLDSLVSPKSVCSQLARRVGVRFAKRDVFLDNREEPAYIRSQINKLKLQAKVKGYAVGIGHDQKNTLEVLEEAMPQLEKEGYKFVFVSDLLTD